MNLGSSYSSLKAAVADNLSARSGLSDVTVLAWPPLEASELKGPDGSGKAIWIADTPDGEYENVVMGAPDLWLDETYTLTLVLQALPNDTDDTQLITDQRVDEMLYEVLQESAQDTAWGLQTGDDQPFVFVEATRGAFQRFVGPIPNGATRPSRCQLSLDVHARIQFPGN